MVNFEEEPKEIPLEGDEDTDRISKLINQLSDNRKPLTNMLGDVVDLRIKLKDLLPTDLSNFRYPRVLEEKMKAISGVLSTELQIRKYIDGSLSEEIRLLQKTDIDDTYGESSRVKIEALAKVLSSQLSVSSKK